MEKRLPKGNPVRRSVPVGLVVLLSLSLLLSACGGSTSGATAEPSATPEPDRRQVTVGLVQAPVSLDPADHRDRQSETVIRNMFDGLVTRDSRNQVYPELAQSLNWLDDQTLQVQLRQGVLFHDGVEMTAEDVVFTFERILQKDGIDYPAPHSSPRQGLVGPLESVEKIDDYTAVLHFSTPFPSATQMLVHQQIVPKHYFEKVGTQGFLAHPIGTGPFKFVSAGPNLKEIVLERFDDYYGGAPALPPAGPACLDRVVFRVIPDTATRAAALLIDEVDIMQSVPLELLDVLEARPNIQVKAAPGTQPQWVEMNVARAPFDDVRVRRALNYAIDKERIIQTVYGGRAVPLPGPLSPYNNFVNDDLAPYPYDPGRALALLAAAGWEDIDADGMLQRNGRVFSFVLDTVPEWSFLAAALAEQLQAIGIEAQVRIWDANIIRPELLLGERDAYLDDWGDSAFDPVGHFEAKWHGGGALENGTQRYGRANYSGYNNRRVNELIEQGEVTADPRKRQEIYDEAQQIIYDDAPAIFLVLPEQIEAASTRVQNWEPASDSRINLHDVCVEP
jgi:peptide/nickel transport system substrate-binding protein